MAGGRAQGQVASALVFLALVVAQLLLGGYVVVELAWALVGR